MAKLIVVTIRGKKVHVDPGTKADIARQLFALDKSYTVTEVAKAASMNYSQAHTIAAKMDRLPSQDPERRANIQRHTGRTVKPYRPEPPLPRNRHIPKAENLESIAKATVPTARQKAKAEKQIKAAMRGQPPLKVTSPRIGKLRTPGHPGDVGAGECANCGHDLVVRKGPQYMLIHVNVTPEEHMAVTQFCTAVPLSLLE